ncbi:MAG TPA: hypothetical protein VGG86_15470, partial [Roseiarcus sp.]
ARCSTPEGAPLAGRGELLDLSAFGWNRHREERSDAAIQGSPCGPSSLDRFAYARDDGVAFYEEGEA